MSLWSRFSALMNSKTDLSRKEVELRLAEYKL